MPDKTWDVGVSAIVVRNERVLLVRYAYGTHKGMWTLPGGYTNHDETLDCAALRELQEEAGLADVARGIVGREAKKAGMERLPDLPYVVLAALALIATASTSVAQGPTPS